MHINKYIVKIILTILIIFSHHPWTKADDIRDFEIEGIGIGESLTKIMSIKDIKQNILPYFKDTRKYYIVGLVDNLQQYDQLEFYIKTNDKSYKILTIVAGIYSSNLDSCLKKKKIIAKDLTQLFSNVKKISGKKKHEIDPKGKSYHYMDQFNLNYPNHIRVECTDFSKEILDSKIAQNSLNVVVMTKEINDWIYGGYR